MKTKDSTFDFNQLIPMPEDVEKYAGENPSIMPGWYNWSVDNWGTKWNAYSIVVEWGEIYFQTAWATPEPILRALSKRFPNDEIRVEYADEDAGRNCGIIIYKNGKKVVNRTDETEPEFPWTLFADKLWYELNYHEKRKENEKLRELLNKHGIEE